MSNRCPGCGKLASYEYDEPEINSEDFDAEGGGIDVSARIVLRSACCSEDLKDYEFEFSESLSEDVVKAHQGEDHQLEFALTDEEITERYQDKDRHGKPIKNARYMKKFYGVRLEWEVTCKCSTEPVETGTFDDEAGASDMNECN